MAYLGAQPNKTLTKTTSQSFNGTGSATTFTLNRAVNTEEELEVFVENVQQEPGSGKSYTASGTTLTFDEAPPSGTGNVYVIYRGQAEVTTRLEHDANQALSATTGTFTQLNSDNIRIDGNTISSTDTNGDITLDPNGTGNTVVASGNVGVGVSTITTGTLGTSNTFIEAAGPSGGSGTLVLSRETNTDNDEVGGVRFVNRNNADDDGLDADGKLIANINARVETSDSNAGDDSGGHLIFSTKPEAGSYAERMRIDSNGRVIMPNQVALSVGLGADFTHTTGQGNKITGWSRRTATDGFRFSSSRSAASMFPEGSDSDDNRFIAPADGLYLMFFKPDITATITTGWYIHAGINGATRTVDIVEDIPHYSNSGFYCPFIMELQTDDYVQVYTNGGASYGLRGSSSYHQYHTWWYITKIA